MKVCEPTLQPQTSARANFPITLNQLYINGERRNSHNGKTLAVMVIK